MALLSVAVYDLPNSGRTQLTENFFQSLLDTVDFRHHRIFVIDNASCQETQEVIMQFAKLVEEINPQGFGLFHNSENIGTAKAVNMGLKERKPREHCVKCDNDVIFNEQNWLEKMEDALRRMPEIGVLGLKRKDLGENTWNEIEHYRTTLHGIKGNLGERHLIFEKVEHGVMGTCTMYNYALLDKIGFLYQPTIYGWDDGLISTRSKLAGFVNGFLPQIDIDHPDPGNTFYQTWKESHAKETIDIAGQVNADYLSGRRPIYEEA